MGISLTATTVLGIFATKGKIAFCASGYSGRGECSAHYIREDVLRELVLERIQAVNEYIRGDVEGFQEEWLHYRRADQERDIRED